MARPLIYENIVSADLYYEDASGKFDWAMPDEELHAFINKQQEAIDTFVFGRRMYEIMRVWDDWPTEETPGPETEFKQLWARKKKLVASRSLKDLGKNAEPIEGDLVAAVTALKQQEGGAISVGGGEVARPLIEAGLVDIFSLNIVPVLVGGGKPYWPAGISQTDLTLTAYRQFSAGFVHLQYRRKGPENREAQP